MNETRAMRRALDLAWRGWGRVHPNPMVGAVVLRGTAKVGEGFHEEYGGLHAERVALDAAGQRARGGTLVLTLEPCAHQGKQPPCTDAILTAGVKRVVAACADPNPLAAGGAAILREHGVEVEIGLLEQEARRQNALFLHAAREVARPFVALKLAASMDARIADHAGQSRWVSGPEALKYVHWLRAGFDAIAVGGRTARADDPVLTVRGTVAPRIPPVRIVFDREGGLNPESRLARSAGESPVLLVTAGTVPPVPGVKVVTAGSLYEALGALRNRGITSLLVEGGGRLAGALLEAQLVDRVYWIQAPVWLGERGVPAFAGLGSPDLAAARRWSVVERRPLDQDTLLVLERN
ncbi:MAG: bifunctional diaminohydroxyphosphoribosylaminopyrimidine deaminase/5-amino-6-(5-phosphoribosylamino)uracil reductase RibD [Gemmatimonadales bacterium]